MSVAAGWLADPGGAHELRYWDGASWTDHVSDRGVAAVDPAGVALPPPPGADPAPAASGGGWKDRLKAAATTAAAQGKQLAGQARSMAGEQQAKRLAELAADPDTVWFGTSKGAAASATGVSKALYRITRDRLEIDTGVLGVRSEQVPLWAVRDLDVRQSVLQRGKDVGDVALHLEDPGYGAGDPGTTYGTVVLDDIEGPHKVRDLLLPLITEARSRKVAEWQGAGASRSTGAPPDIADQLRRLAELRDEGILSDEELAAQKARLLHG